MAVILCVDDEPQLLNLLARMLRPLGHSVRTAASVHEALQVISREVVDLVVTDWSMPHLSGLDLLHLLRDDGNDTPVVMLTAFGSIDHAVLAIQAGAANYLTKPFQRAQIEFTVTQTLKLATLGAQNAALVREAAAQRSQHEIVGESAAVRRLLKSVAAAASSRATVLLEGESGTGKELLARAIHDQSEQSQCPFLQVNCAALPEHLIESALFGHEKGAFTGAYKRSLGAFERAHGGTLLLDEISEMRIDLQPKLLRVLQEREFERVGGSANVKVDVRIIATTNRDLATQIAAGRFRQDLYYRLSVLPISVPPLRDRREDIPGLAYRFAVRAAAEAAKPFEAFTPAAMARLEGYSWPGNIRQLQHAVERAVIFAQRPVLDVALFDLAADAGAPQETPGSARPSNSEGFLLDTLNLETVEQQVIAHALRVANGNRTRSATLLGVDVRTLRRKLNASVEDAPLPRDTDGQEPVSG
jgi:Response regulator containing CheY-like receiver, AAA-type ATPase, and DNA-binding domains